jgi:hypothetical protein
MIDFQPSSAQPLLGHSSQPTGKSQLARGDSGVMPRKTVESDVFEKQPPPPASVDKNRVVPTMVATAILSPILGALAGEWAWKWPSVDVEEGAVASTTSPTVETSVKEGVKTLKGLGSWFRTPTETLQQTGGAALEKHATTSRWIAGNIALTTLILGGAFAFFTSQKKPKNQSIDANYNSLNK